MQLSEILTRDVETIGPDTSAREAAQRMRSMDVGSLPVCDGQRLLGIVTDRDLTLRILAEGRDPNATPVQDAMTPDVCFAYEDDDVRRAAEIMKDRQIRRLPVVNREKKLVGIVAIGDIATNATDQLTGDTLEKISEPSRPA